MIPSSTRMFLGSAVLAGLLLASDHSGSALSQTQTVKATISLSMKPILVASSTASNRTDTDTVRKQMKWTSNLTKQSYPVIVATEQITTKTQQPVKFVAQPKHKVSRSDDGSTLVNNALSLQGVPYVFGGTNRSGFDCSGYTQYVFKISGISLPRTSFDQFNSGSKVSRKQLQSGDLVFFTTYAKGSSHVGIYIGGGRFVHASNSGVRVTSLSDNYYSSRYLGARRMS